MEESNTVDGVDVQYIQPSEPSMMMPLAIEAVLKRLDVIEEKLDSLGESNE